MAAEHKFGIVPDLTAIGADPDVARHLPADQVEALLATCSVCQGALVNRLLALRASTNGQGQTKPDGDRLLTAEDAARKLGKSKDALYRHAGDYPFTVRDGRSLRFSEQGIEKFIRQRLGR